MKTYQVYRLASPYGTDFKTGFANKISMWVDEFTAQNNSEVLVQAVSAKPFVSYKPEWDVIMKGSKQVDLPAFPCGARLAPVTKNMGRVQWFTLMV